MAEKKESQHALQEQWQKRDTEYGVDTNGATHDPIKHRVEVVASRLAGFWLITVVLAEH